MTWNRPTSAVEPTCVPPQSSRETPSTSTIRTQSPYFSPKSAIAPSRSASSRRRVHRAHRMVLDDPGVHRLLDVRQLLLRQALAVGEVEAQLVRADVGPGLADVRAEPLAQRRVQQVRGGVVAHRREAARRGPRPPARAGPRRARPRRPRAPRPGRRPGGTRRPPRRGPSPSPRRPSPTPGRRPPRRRGSPRASRAAARSRCSSARITVSHSVAS